MKAYQAVLENVDTGDIEENFGFFATHELARRRLDKEQENFESDEEVILTIRPIHIEEN